MNVCSCVGKRVGHRRSTTRRTVGEHRWPLRVTGRSGRLRGILDALACLLAAPLPLAFTIGSFAPVLRA